MAGSGWLERALLAGLWAGLVEHLLPAGLAPAATARPMCSSSNPAGMKQAHTVFPRCEVSFKNVKAAERNHQKIKEMEHTYQDTAMALCTEDADLLCGYDKTDFKK